MPYHVMIGANRFVIEQDTLLQNFLSQQNPNDIVIVKTFDYIERGTSIYGSLPGMQSLPALEVPADSTVVSIQHLTVNAEPM